MTMRAIRCHHRFAGPDRPLPESAVGNHGRAHALGPETRERLRISTLFERGEGQQVSRGHGALPPPAVKAHFEHHSSVRPISGTE